MVAPFIKFYGRTCLGFVLTVENAFSQRFLFKDNRKYTRDFQNSPPFERSACFYVRISGNFEQLQTFNFERDFLENELLFLKLEYRLLVESTKIENA